MCVNSELSWDDSEDESCILNNKKINTLILKCNKVKCNKTFSGFATVRTLLLLLCALLPIFVLFSDLSKIFTSADQHSAQTTHFFGKRGLFASHCQQFTFRRPINTAVYIQTDERKCL